MQSATPQCGASKGIVSVPLLSAMASVALFGCTVAHADCKSVINAMEKSGRMERRAMYSVDGPTQKPSGRPEAIIIGHDIYVHIFGKTHVTKGGNSSDAAAETIRAGEKKGKTSCRSVGPASYFGAAVDRIQITSSESIGDLGNTVVWIDRATGLATYQDVGEPASGGYAWVYGAAVPEPDAGAGPMKDTVGKAIGSLQKQIPGK